MLTALDLNASTAMMKVLAGPCATIRQASGGVDEKDTKGAEPKTAISILLHRYAKSRTEARDTILEQIDAVRALSWMVAVTSS